MVDRELILRRMNQLREQEKAAWAQLNAVLGAIEDCEFWLRLLDEQEAEERRAQFADRVARPLNGQETAVKEGDHAET